MDALLLLLKATLLLSLPLLAARLLSRAPAAVRHGLWTLTFAAVLLLPMLASLLPVLAVPVPARWDLAAMGGTPTPDAVATPRAAGERAATDLADPAEARAADSEQRAAGARSARTASMSSVSGAAAPDGARLAADVADGGVDRAGTTGMAGALNAVAVWRGWPTVRVVLSIMWLAGTIAATTVLIVSLVRVWRLARRAEELADPAWRQAAGELGARLGLRRSPRLLASAGVSTPMAAGVWRPVIFLPESAREWSAECRDVVLAHEIAHLAVRDPLRHLTARLAVACYWFHPLAWFAARHATMAREQACDEAVLALGTRPSAYARVLLDLADSMTLAPPAPALGALPMVERSLLETRLMAILNADVRPGTGRRVLMPAVGIALLTLSVAAAHPVARTASVPAQADDAGAPTSSFTPSPVQADQNRAAACSWDLYRNLPFDGNMETTTDSSGREVLREQIGRSAGNRIIMTTIGTLRMCMVADDVADRWEPPSQWLDGTARVVMEARRGTTVQRFELRRQFGGGQQISWRVGGAERPFDAAAEAWRDQMLETLDAIWDVSMLHGRRSTLRGEISTIHGQESTLRGQISTLQGEVSTMQGRISTIQGEKSTLQGRISTIQGEVSTMQGAISTEQGAISSIQATRYGATEADRAHIAQRIARHEAAIKDIEQRIRTYDAASRIAAVQREIDQHNTQRKVTEIEQQILAFDLPGKVAAVERQIRELNVQGKIDAIERQIRDLDFDRRVRQLEEARDAQIRRLDAAMGAIR